MGHFKWEDFEQWAHRANAGDFAVATRDVKVVVPDNMNGRLYGSTLRLASATTLPREHFQKFLQSQREAMTAEFRDMVGVPHGDNQHFTYYDSVTQGRKEMDLDAIRFGDAVHRRVAQGMGL
jgi:hypothetical protein